MSKVAGTVAAALAVAALASWAPAAEPTGKDVAPASITLENSVTLARQRSQRVREAEAGATIGEARVDKARAFFFPDLTLNGQWTLRPAASNPLSGRKQSTFLASAVASWTLFDGRALPLYRQAKASRDASALDAGEASRLVGFEAADAFFQTLGAEQVALAAHRRLAFARERLADAEARADAHLSSSNDVTRAKVEVAAAERADTTASGTLADSYLLLGDLVGAEVTGPLTSPAGLMAAARRPIDGGAADTLWSQAQHDRLDLRADARRVDAARAGAEVPRRAFWPTLGVTGQLQASSAPQFGADTLDWFIGVAATWNVWDGGTRAADQREADASVTISEQNLSETERTARLQLRRAVLALATAQTSVGQAEQQVELTRKNADEVIVLYGQGLARAIEVADANQQMFDADVALAQANFGLAIAYLDLRATLGLDPTGEEVKW